MPQPYFYRVIANKNMDFDDIIKFLLPKSTRKKLKKELKKMRSSGWKSSWLVRMTLSCGKSWNAPSPTASGSRNS